ncbi:hypothetical protein IFM53868_08441 [Aspergillus udagawae]|uniref:Uncharacterized protein n=1 Tax=Aspergillus udagawae TaxID=91492 RepID=A0ABQ1B8T5_9EURO|nr:hypothetical protein IFM53868_08441 [Aspergillus udagawae]
MATRLFPFAGDDAQYISFLEDVIQRSGLVGSTGLTMVPEGTSSLASSGPACHTPPPSEDEGCQTPEELQIIPYSPEKKSGQVSNGISSQPNQQRRDRELVDFVSQIPNINQLDLRIKELGLGDNRIVISSAVGAFTKDGTNSGNFPISTSPALLALCKYALATNQSHEEATLHKRLSRFQELIFLCLCDVVMKSGEPKEKIHEIMSLHLSNYSWQYLDRLLCGSRWVNRCIIELSETAWGLRSAEIFILRYKHDSTLHIFEDFYKDKFGDSISMPSRDHGDNFHKRKRGPASQPKKGKRARRVQPQSGTTPNIRRISSAFHSQCTERAYSNLQTLSHASQLQISSNDNRPHRPSHSVSQHTSAVHEPAGGNRDSICSPNVGATPGANRAVIQQSTSELLVPGCTSSFSAEMLGYGQDERTSNRSCSVATAPEAHLQGFRYDGDAITQGEAAISTHSFGNHFQQTHVYAQHIASTPPSFCSGHRDQDYDTRLLRVQLPEAAPSFGGNWDRDYTGSTLPGDDSFLPDGWAQDYDATSVRPHLLEATPSFGGNWDRDYIGASLPAEVLLFSGNWDKDYTAAS